MLQFLDSGNPLVRYHTSIWINDCFPSFHRVLNPLLEILLKPGNFWYKTSQGQYIYVIRPDPAEVLRVLSHLGAIIQHAGEKFLKFSLKDITQNLQPYYEIFKGYD